MSAVIKYEEIPALEVMAKGEVTSSNLTLFKEKIAEWLGFINLEPQTDEEFGQATIDAKNLKAAETALADAKTKAIQQAESLYALFSQIDESGEQIRGVRLTLERSIKEQKEKVKTRIIQDGINRIECAPRLRVGKFRSAIESAISGKRTIDSMEKAVDVAVTTINSDIRKSKEHIAAHIAEHGKGLVLADEEELETRPPVEVEMELRRRVEVKKADDEKAQLKAETNAQKAEIESLKEKDEFKKSIAELAGESQAQKEASPALSLINAERQEWDAYCAKILTAFASIKEARAALVYSRNQSRANGMAAGMNAVWKEWK